MIREPTGQRLLPIGLASALLALLAATNVMASACSIDPSGPPTDPTATVPAPSPTAESTAPPVTLATPAATPTSIPTPTPTPTATEIVESALSIWPWFNDGLDEGEAELVRDLKYLYGSIARQIGGDLAGKLLTMPFLETVEDHDNAAVTSLLIVRRERDGTRRFKAVMAHPSVSDGISDREAKVLATLGSAVAYGPSWLLPFLLDPEFVTIEERQVDLPLSGQVELALIRTEPGAVRTMDVLEHSVRTAEKLLQAPLPTRYVGVLFGDVVELGAPAQNFDTHIGMLARYDVDQDHYTADYSAILMAHEVAHYYWRGNSSWLDEGLANLMGVIAEHTRGGRPIEPATRLCREARNILSLYTLSRNEFAFECYYSLSERFFLDLYRNLDEQVFLAALRNLYRLSLQDNPADSCLGTRLTICHVRAAFTNDDLPDSSRAIAEKIIARWYEGTEPYDPTTFTEKPDPSLVTVDGNLDRAYLSRTPDGGDDGNVFSLKELEGEIWLHVEISYDPQTAGREVPLEIVSYYEDGFAFGRQAEPYEFYHREGSDEEVFAISFWVGRPPEELAIGRYAVHLYDGPKKILELEYEIVP